MQVLLVGGFAQNPYLQSRVRAALVDTGLAKELVVPPHPYSAVLQGTHPGLHPCLLNPRAVPGLHAYMHVHAYVHMPCTY